MPFRTQLAALEIVSAPVIWLVASWGALTGREPFASWLYHFAWWPYILFLDGMLLRLTGRSWIIDRPRELARMMFWSVTAWLVFEAANLVLGNWRYAGMTPQWWLRWPGYALAFATVLPGVLLTAHVLEALGAWKNAGGRPRDLGSWQPWSLILGAACLVLPLIFPGWAFPLIWVAFFFLLDPLCQLFGGPSLIAHFAAGERGEGLCLLAAGLICGVWWELWNYGARAKWIYTLPTWDWPKVFEMPLLGYLGFLPFALECAVMYNFMRALGDRGLITPERRRYAYLCQAVFWILMFAAIDRFTVISFK